MTAPTSKPSEWDKLDLPVLTEVAEDHAHSEPDVPELSVEDAPAAASPVAPTEMLSLELPPELELDALLEEGAPGAPPPEFVLDHLPSLDLAAPEAGAQPAAARPAAVPASHAQVAEPEDFVFELVPDLEQASAGATPAIAAEGFPLPAVAADPLAFDVLPPQSVAAALPEEPLWEALPVGEDWEVAPPDEPNAQQRFEREAMTPPPPETWDAVPPEMPPVAEALALQESVPEPREALGTAHGGETSSDRPGRLDLAALDSAAQAFDEPPPAGDRPMWEALAESPAPVVAEPEFAMPEEFDILADEPAQTSPAEPIADMEIPDLAAAFEQGSAGGTARHEELADVPELAFDEVIEPVETLAASAPEIAGVHDTAGSTPAPGITPLEALPEAAPLQTVDEFERTRDEVSVPAVAEPATLHELADPTSALGVDSAAHPLPAEPLNDAVADATGGRFDESAMPAAPSPAPADVFEHPVASLEPPAAGEPVASAAESDFSCERTDETQTQENALSPEALPPELPAGVPATAAAEPAGAETFETLAPPLEAGLESADDFAAIAEMADALLPADAFAGAGFEPDSAFVSAELQQEPVAEPPHEAPLPEAAFAATDATDAVVPVHEPSGASATPDEAWFEEEWLDQGATVAETMQPDEAIPVVTEQLAPEPRSEPAYQPVQSIDLDSLPRGVLQVPEMPPVVEPLADATAPAGPLTALQAQLDEIRAQLDSPLAEPAVFRTQPQREQVNAHEEPADAVPAVTRPAPSMPEAESFPEESFPDLASSAASPASRSEEAMAVVGEDKLIESLYQRILPRMKVELGLWLQDALELQSKQLLAGVMQQLKEDYEPMFGETLRESLRQAISDSGRVEQRPAAGRPGHSGGD